MPSHPERVRRNYPHQERPHESEPPPPKKEKPKEDDRPPREYTRGERRKNSI